MGMRDAWDIPEFRRLLVGNGVNMMGSSIFIIGMSWTVAQIGGPKMFGLIWTPTSSVTCLSYSMAGWWSTGCPAGPSP